MVLFGQCANLHRHRGAQQVVGADRDPVSHLCWRSARPLNNTLGGTLGAALIPKERARPLRVARIVVGLAFAGFVIAAAVGSKLIGVAFAVAAIGLLVAYAWRCPVCGKTFAFKFGLVGIAMPYTNMCLHCGSRLQ